MAQVTINPATAKDSKTVKVPPGHGAIVIPLHTKPIYSKIGSGKDRRPGNETQSKSLMLGSTPWVASSELVADQPVLAMAQLRITNPNYAG